MVPTCFGFSRRKTTVDKSQRPVFDTSMTEASRIQESSSPRLHPDGQEFPDGIALCRILVRMGRMQQDQWPVPRAGRQERAAESYLKPRVVEFIENNRKVVDLLFEQSKFVRWNCQPCPSMPL